MNNASPEDELAAIIASHGEIGGRYGEITRLNTGGAGHFSLMFSALDRPAGKSVALKFLHPKWNGTYRERSFHREATICQALRGKDNIVQMCGKLDLLELDLTHPQTGLGLQIPCHYYVLELAKGDFAQYLLARKKPPPLFRRLEMVRGVVKGVNRLHQEGYCHRDLKPDNIFIFSGGTPKVGDFGTARSLAPENLPLVEYEFPVGAKTYTAPEILCGGWNDRDLFCGADWFSVGSILFEALTGVPLYVAIGLDGTVLQDIVSTFQSIPEGSRLEKFARVVATISGQHPVPNLGQFLREPWFAHSSRETAEALDRLVRSMCHFDFRRRLSDFDRVLRRLDICLRRVKLEQEEHNKRAMRRRKVAPVSAIPALLHRH